MSDRDPVLAAIGSLSTDLNAFRTDLTSFRSEVSARLDQVGDRLDRVEGRMDSIEDGFARFRTDLVDERGNTRSALMARMDRLQDAVRQEQIRQLQGS